MINPYSENILVATPTELTDKNLFSYCDNNPIIRADNGGEFWHVVAGAVIGGAIELGSQLLSGEKVNWLKVGIEFVSGGAQAALGPVGGTIVGVIADVATDGIDGKINSGLDLACSIGDSVVLSIAGHGLGTAIKKIGGKIAVKTLSKTSKTNIKKVVNKLMPDLIDGSRRNSVKNLLNLSKMEMKALQQRILSDNAKNAIDLGVSVAFNIGDRIYGH